MANVVAVLIHMNAVTRTELRKQAACMTRKKPLILVDGREVAVEQINDVGEITSNQSCVDAILCSRIATSGYDTIRQVRSNGVSVGRLE